MTPINALAAVVVAWRHGTSRAMNDLRPGSARRYTPFSAHIH